MLASSQKFIRHAPYYDDRFFLKGKEGYKNTKLSSNDGWEGTPTANNGNCAKI